MTQNVACTCTSRDTGWTLDGPSGEWVCGQCRRPSQATINRREGKAAGGFVHLQVRSQYAPMAGAVRIKDLISWAKANDVQHVAISDPGTMHGAFSFQKAVKAAGLTPIHAVQWPEATLVALTPEGLRSLILACSHAQMGVAPPEQMPGVLIATSDRVTDEEIATLKDGYAKVAIQLPVGREDSWSELAAIAAKHRLPLLPAVDVRYANFDQRLDYLLLEAVRQKKQLTDVDAPGYHLLDVSEMADRYQDYPEVWDGMHWLLQHDFPLLEPRRDLWPEFPTPEGVSLNEHLLAEISAGVERRYPGMTEADAIDEVTERIDYEYDIITSKGYAGYFLVVADLVGWAKSQGIRVGPGRGSAAGALISYVLGITDTDPLQHGLLFERFLNPERESPPDIDLDFEQGRRQEVIAYLVRRWGEDRVAQIGTLGTFKAKVAIKDAQRALGLPFALGERVSAAVPPPIVGRDCPLYACFDEAHERYEDASAMRELCDSEPEARLVVDHALRLEGLTRQMGVHAAGVVVSSHNLAETVPMMVNEDKSGHRQFLTQMDYPSCETLGLLKIDVLGLRNLDILGAAIANVEESTGQQVDPLRIPLADDETLDLLGRGDTLGVFQLDSGPMRGLLRAMIPDKFADVAAVLALYRPGPMAAGFHHAYAKRKNGLEERQPIHPEFATALEPVLGLTYDVLVYQEQTMQLARVLAGYSLGAADELRRAMGKKKREVMEAEFVNFNAGAKALGYSDEAIESVWSAIAANADYQFNQSHAVSYGLLSWWTAFLKAHYPTEYMAALLSNSDTERTPGYLQECRRMGIQVLPPHVTRSGADYRPIAGERAIRVGLASIKGISPETANRILAGRRDDAPETLLGWAATVPPGLIGKLALEALIRAGALDGLGHSRKSLLAGVPKIMPSMKAAAQAAEFGLSMFPLDLEIAVPDKGEFTRTEILALEKAAFGLYVSDHPLAVLAQDVASFASHSVAELPALPDKEKVRISGLVTSMLRKTTKEGNRPWVILGIEDLDGDVEVLLFPQSWAEVKGFVREGVIVVVEGRVKKRDGATSVIPDSVSVLEVGAERPIVVRLPAAKAALETAEDILLVAQKYPGKTALQVALVERGHWKLIEVGRVRSCPEIVLDLKLLFGPRAVRVG